MRKKRAKDRTGDGKWSGERIRTSPATTIAAAAAHMHNFPAGVSVCVCHVSIAVSQKPINYLNRWILFKLLQLRFKIKMLYPSAVNMKVNCEWKNKLALNDCVCVLSANARHGWRNENGFTWFLRVECLDLRYNNNIYSSVYFCVSQSPN